jgi:hypothetical protein
MKLSTLTDTIKFWVDKLNEPIVDTTFADYYNGSDNELENIFLEIEKLTSQPVNIFNIDDYKRRLDFLANEGLNIISFSEKPKSFKVTPKEADELILNLAKKTKKVSKAKVKKNIKAAVKNYKKNLISSVDIKPLKTKKTK